MNFEKVLKLNFESTFWSWALKLNLEESGLPFESIHQQYSFLIYKVKKKLAYSYQNIYQLTTHLSLFNSLITNADNLIIREPKLKYKKYS